MKKGLIILAVLVVAGGLVGWGLMRDSDSDTSTTHTSEEHEASETESETADVSAADAAHLSGANIGQTVNATDQTAVMVMMEDFEFETTTLTIKKGTTVTWMNEGDAGHTVTSSSSSPQQFTSSGTLQNGDEYSFTFDEVGTYYYFCTPHASQMRGIVHVVE